MSMYMVHVSVHGGGGENISSTPISLSSTFSRPFICRSARPSCKTRLVAQRGLVAASPRAAQWRARQRARCGRELPRC
jgi:hypothetical protein